MKYNSGEDIYLLKTPGIAKSYLNLFKDTYLLNSLKKQGAIDSVNRILENAKTETGERIKVTLVFKQQLRLIADNRLRHVLTTGASQISKSLANYLVAVDELINGQINIGWVYASRQSMQNQQPLQFQEIVKNWRGEMPKTQRESITRFKIGKAVANFTYANSSSEVNSGGAAEGKEQNSFQASKLYLEEKSSWKKNIDLSPRLGASRLKAKPIREIGTPGSGTGIEKAIKTSAHNFEPGVMCPSCDEISWLHPLGNLFIPKMTAKGLQYFDNRGAILNFYGTEIDPYVVCNHCKVNITRYIHKAQLYSRQSLQSVDEFLDELPEFEIYYPSVSIYLSPLLKVPDDPYRLRDLVREGLEPDNALIYHQNKLGIESIFTVNGITHSDYQDIKRQEPWFIQKPLRIVGIDQGTDSHYLVEIEVDKKNELHRNITNVVAISEDGIIQYLRNRSIDFGLIDNEPGRKSASELCDASNGILAMADQRNIMPDVNQIKVSFGGLEVKCWAINNTLFKEEIFSGFHNKYYRISCEPHRKFATHITSIKRDLETGEFIRPSNHDDDFFFALMFAEAAKILYFKNFKAPATSHFIGNKLLKYKYYG